MSSSWDDARRCPTHGMAGKETERIMGKRGTSLAGSKIVTLECVENNCPTGTWIVQIRPDGTIPEPTTERDKQYTPLESWQLERGKAMVENTLERQLEAEQKRGAEIDRDGRIVA